MVLPGEPRKKSPVTPPGIDPGTVRLVAQRLNHYATPGPGNERYPMFKFSEPLTKLNTIVEFVHFLLTVNSRHFVIRPHEAECCLRSQQLAKTFPAFYDNKNLFPLLHQPATCPYTPTHPISLKSILILSSHLRLGLKAASFLQVSPPKLCMKLSSPPCALHTRTYLLIYLLHGAESFLRS